MISPIKYLTIEDLVRLGAKKRPELWAKVERGCAYPVTRTATVDDQTVSVSVALNYSGDQAEFRMSVAELSALTSIPTHESVAAVPRLDVRGK